MRKIHHISHTILLGLICYSPLLSAASTTDTSSDSFKIDSENGNINILAGELKRSIQLNGSDIETTGIDIGGENILSAANELSLRIEIASPNREPLGLEPQSAGSVTQQTAVSDSTDALDVQEEGGSAVSEDVAWIEARDFNAKNWGKVFDLAVTQVSSPQPDIKQVIIRVRALDDPSLKNVAINIFYQVYEGYPVIRKWIEVNNNSPSWIKLSKLIIDDIQIKENFQHRTYLTPSERGAVSSIIGFNNSSQTRGVILASEIPSALRSINDNGAMGYSEEHFEWILGPAESFTSEPVFMYAFSGDVTQTISGTSNPLDRAVERPFKTFLKEHVGVAANAIELPGPIWCTWSNFAENIDDAIIREQAEIAARAGFEIFQIDDGWQRGRLGVIPDTDKFPDFNETCRFIKSQGIGLGLWVSCFRQPDSDDLKALPNAPSAPEIRRLEGVAMSFSSKWSKYFGNQLVFLHDYYGATYFKQDFTNIKYGDFAQGHDSRSKKESLLRGIRGLFESQDILRSKVPGIANQITHEIYWGTPGVPCDIAALKHAVSYHIPPNDYSGAGHWKERAGATDWWDKADPAEQSKMLLEGCYNSRERFYLHRGLPLEGIEYYGASTVNVKGSLTPEIQDRQICSWLMGAPTVYAGDLASLTEENIQRYRDRLEIIKTLHGKYDIYRNFQYSGVPAPTDEDWHWWGKLNENNEGAVVVMRGNGGKDQRAVNIPWVNPDKLYELKAWFADKKLGTFTGSDLIEGKLQIHLPQYGQDIIEIQIKQETPSL